MIKLATLLKEIQGSPKAIFLAGPAGSGKSTLTKQLLPSSYQVINSDDTYEELLKASGIGLKQKDFTPDQLSQAAKLQAQARKTTQDKLAQSIEDKNNIIIDGTGAASGPLLKKKQQLEDLGYETFMLMIYVSPLTSLERNQQRDRSLMPGIVLRTWRDVNKNIGVYEQAFGDNFVLLNNNPEDNVIWILGTREGNAEDEKDVMLRTADVDKYPNLTVDVISTSGEVSGTKARQALNISKEDFFTFLPDEIKDEKEGVYNILTKTQTQERFVPGPLLHENFTPQKAPLMGRFVDYACDRLNIDKPKVFVINSPTYSQEHKSFGGYYPQEQEIKIVVHNRNMADILRTLAHELVHHMQNLNGKELNGEDGSDTENEANAMAGVIMREFGRENP